MISTFLDIEIIQKLQALEASIGNTSLLEVKHLNPNKNVKIYAKAEWENIGGSIKARPAFNIIKRALLDQKWDPGQTLLDASSGNTGIAYAAIAKALGLQVKLVIPANASQARKDILEQLGAELIYSSALEGTDGAQELAKSLSQQYPWTYFYADQYSNDHNWKAHYKTAQEIWTQTKGSITHFITGVGTSGTFTGTTIGLKKKMRSISAIEVQPDLPMHGLEGWKHMQTAAVPKFYQSQLADEKRSISSQKAYDYIKLAKQKEAWDLSPSAAANLAAAIELATEISQGVIVTTFPDNASKYLDVIKQILK